MKKKLLANRIFVPGYMRIIHWVMVLGAIVTSCASIYMQPDRNSGRLFWLFIINVFGIIPELVGDYLSYGATGSKKQHQVSYLMSSLKGSGFIRDAIIGEQISAFVRWLVIGGISAFVISDGDTTGRRILLASAMTLICYGCTELVKLITRQMTISIQFLGFVIVLIGYTICAPVFLLMFMYSVENGIELLIGILVLGVILSVVASYFCIRRGRIGYTASFVDSEVSE